MARPASWDIHGALLPAPLHWLRLPDGSIRLGIEGGQIHIAWGVLEARQCRIHSLGPPGGLQCESVGVREELDAASVIG